MTVVAEVIHTRRCVRGRRNPCLVNVTGCPSTSIPVRISGPLVSNKTAHTLPVLAHAALRFWSDSRWYSWVPWLKLKRAAG